MLHRSRFLRIREFEKVMDDCGFSDLAPATLAAILSDCAAFQASRAWADAMEDFSGCDEANGGHDFWLTRNGHGAGFWDGAWHEPHASALTKAAKAFGPRDAYLGDDGKVHV